MAEVYIKGEKVSKTTIIIFSVCTSMLWPVGGHAIDLLNQIKCTGEACYQIGEERFWVYISIGFGLLWCSYCIWDWTHEKTSFIRKVLVLNENG